MVSSNTAITTVPCTTVAKTIQVNHEIRKELEDETETHPREVPIPIRQTCTKPMGSTLAVTERVPYLCVSSSLSSLVPWRWLSYLRAYRNAKLFLIEIDRGTVTLCLICRGLSTTGGYRVSSKRSAFGAPCFPVTCCSGALNCWDGGVYVRCTLGGLSKPPVILCGHVYTPCSTICCLCLDPLTLPSSIMTTFESWEAIDTTSNPGSHSAASTVFHTCIEVQSPCDTGSPVSGIGMVSCFSNLCPPPLTGHLCK